MLIIIIIIFPNNELLLSFFVVGIMRKRFAFAYVIHSLEYLCHYVFVAQFNEALMRATSSSTKRAVKECPALASFRTIRRHGI